jgi:membrane associated rhomboid family serine protease
VSDVIPSRTVPFITVGLIFLNAWIFLYQLTLSPAALERFIASYALVPAWFAWRSVLTSMFLHAGWMHIIGNMVYLWAFGRAIEEAMGGFRFLAFYLIGGVVAMFAQILGDPFSHLPCLGASGAIAAVMGAFIITFPRDRIRTIIFFFIFFRVTFIPAVLVIGFWFLMQVLNIGSVAEVRTGGVAYLAHIGGFLFGVITGRFLARPNRIAYSRY